MIDDDYCLRVRLQLITDALWEHVPSSNLSQGISRVQLGEFQVELGMQIPLGDEQQNKLC